MIACIAHLGYVMGTQEISGIEQNKQNQEENYSIWAARLTLQRTMIKKSPYKVMQLRKAKVTLGWRYIRY